MRVWLRNIHICMHNIGYSEDKWLLFHHIIPSRTQCLIFSFLDVASNLHRHRPSPIRWTRGSHCITRLQPLPLYPNPHLTPSTYRSINGASTNPVPSPLPSAYPPMPSALLQPLTCTDLSFPHLALSWRLAVRARLRSSPVQLAMFRNACVLEPQ